MSSKEIKTEHSGAKNGGCYWGRRVVAKEVIKKLRRNNSKRIVRKELKISA